MPQYCIIWGKDIACIMPWTSNNNNNNNNNSKLEAGNFRAAIRIVCSSDTPAQASQDTLEALQASPSGPWR